MKDKLKHETWVEFEDPYDSDSKIIDFKWHEETVDFIHATDNEAKQHCRWQLISKDLGLSEVSLLEAIKKLKEIKNFELDHRNIDSVIIKALIESAIIGYIKCFSQAKGRKVKLEYRDTFRSNEGKKFSRQHILVKNCRDGSIAHGGISDQEGSNMVLAIIPADKNYERRLMAFPTAFFKLPELLFLEKSLELIKYVQSYVDKRVNEKLAVYINNVVENPKKYNAERLLRPYPFIKDYLKK